MLLAACCAALWVDVPVAAYFRAHPGNLFHQVWRLELFGHGTGAVLICLAIWRLDRRWRERLTGIVGSVIVAGLLANLFKLMVARSRPFASNLADGNVWDTFVSWLPPLGSAAAAQRSFPSGHTATAVALACSLTVAYPRGRWLFVFLGCGAGLQRVVCGAHFPSDVLAGAAIGWAAGCLVARTRSVPSVTAASSAGCDSVG